MYSLESSRFDETSVSTF